MSWGGRREGAGRKTGSGKFGEPTAPVRVPERFANKIQEVLATYDEHQKLLVEIRLFLDKWDKKTASSESMKNGQKRLARELWHEVKCLLEKRT